MYDRELIDRLSRAAALLFPPHRVLAAYAFGSRVSGRPRPQSDLDVGYYLQGHRGHLEGRCLGIGEEMSLASGLSAAVGLDVDLRDLADAPLELRGRVLEEGIRIFDGDSAARVELERRLLSRYHDYKPDLQRLHALRLRTIAERGL